MIELIVVLVLLAILSSFVASKALPRTGESTAGYQAQLLAGDLRHAQILAMTWGKDLNFTTTSTSYSVSCANSSTGPCAPPSPVVDPGHSGLFTVTLDGVTVATSAPSLTFNILGTPSSQASFTLSSNGVSLATVTVAAGTGFVTVQ